MIVGAEIRGAEVLESRAAAPGRADRFLLRVPIATKARQPVPTCLSGLAPGHFKFLGC